MSKKLKLRVEKLDRELKKIRQALYEDRPDKVVVTHLNPKDAIYITHQQAKYMSDGDCWILGHSDDGWLLVGNGQVDADAEGNGVWVDAAGQEHYGPSGS